MKRALKNKGAKKKSIFENENTVNFISSVMAVICGLLFGFIILFISSPSQAYGGFSMIIQGGFADGISGIGRMLYIAAPIIMTGLSVGFAFKTGLFNIGASGQFTAGAFAAVFVGVKGNFLPSGMHCIAALFAAMAAGALWGSVPGLLKAFFNVNEVISSIMMNYIGMYGVNMLIRRYVYDRIKNQSMPVKSAANLSKAGLDKIFPGSNINVGILIAAVSVIAVHIILHKTVFGYELKACGKNKDASRYAGINEKKNIVLSMVIAGMLSGLGGALLYLSDSGKYMQVLDIIAPEGFLGISVALLGLSEPLGIFLSGLFIGHITVGGSNMQLFDFAPEAIDMIIAAIVYCGALSLLFKEIINRFYKRSLKKTKTKQEDKEKL
ncbi:ABC transporter permease [Johnsonella ignava]|uniref:ABC transporter permease n=1 Tax=Johnsonella ignava TaxID=43995 RepID=UPI0023F122FF|nr:ABC transporter permease [Johnsonella ignava]